MHDSQPLEPLAHSPEGAARRLGVSVRSIYTLISTGALRSARIGKRRLIPEAELVAFLRRRIAEDAKA